MTSWTSGFRAVNERKSDGRPAICALNGFAGSPGRCSRSNFFFANQSLSLARVPGKPSGAVKNLHVDIGEIIRILPAKVR